MYMYISLKKSFRYLIAFPVTKTGKNICFTCDLLELSNICVSVVCFYTYVY